MLHFQRRLEELRDDGEEELKLGLESNGGGLARTDHEPCASGAGHCRDQGGTIRSIERHGPFGCRREARGWRWPVGRRLPGQHASTALRPYRDVATAGHLEGHQD